MADVRAVEQAAMAILPDGELMSRAAAGLADVAGDRLATHGGRRVVALVGGGNNGADALYAVALLAEVGYAAAAVCTAYGSIHQGAREAASEAGVVLVEGDGPDWAAALAEADLVLDGITGIGGRPGLHDEALAWVAAVPDDAHVIAVDLPSGLDPAGLVGTSDAVFADETVTFGAPKPAHLLPATEPAIGRLTVIDIGLDFQGRSPVVERLLPHDVAQLWAWPGASSDKYSRGVVGIVAGSAAYPGAAVLSVLGALGVGPGMVRYFGPDPVAALVHAHAPEAVTAAGRVQAWALGSGVDADDQDDEMQLLWIREALDSDAPCVVDAGALALVKRRAAPTVLTPHAGELARLLTRLGTGPD
ncbi:MAG: NAD(P)H-hydrate epimerase, partial [Candidatus Phosphoribacter sp.]